MAEQNISPEAQALAERFEAHRSHLRSVAYRMLGSVSEAEDAVQQTWFRLSRTDTSDIQSLPGWLTTVVGRVCLDMLRSRKSRREEAMAPGSGRDGDGAGGEAVPPQADVELEPEEEAVLIDSVGRAMLVVLDRLSPAERLAFVLHDMFSVPFDDIGPIVERTPATTKKLASRARERVKGAPVAPAADVAQQRQVVDAFLAASRQGDFDALVAVLDPDVVLRNDKVAVPVGAAAKVHGAHSVAKGALVGARRHRFAQLALVNGSVGVIVAPGGRLMTALQFRVRDRKVAEIDVVVEPARLDQLDIAVLDRHTNLP